MITFTKITAKNFMSVGNIPIEIVIKNGVLTATTGENGAGKSSLLLDTLCFGLYGKAFRKINKDGLVNTVNKKKLVVEVEFETNGNAYLVRRGIKPNILEVYVNGLQKEPPANLRDYQGWLESNVLKLDEKTFRQIVVLGSSSYVPFMCLTAADRRTVIEDLLSIDVFSTMNDIAKREISKVITDKNMLDERVKQAKILIETKRNSLKSIQNTANNIASEASENLKKLDDEIRELSETIDSLIEKMGELALEEANLQFKAAKRSAKEIDNYKHTASSNLKQLEKKVQFFKETPTCPTCSQDISEEYANKIIESEGIRIEKISSAIVDMSEAIQNANAEASNAEKIIDKYKDLQRKISETRAAQKQLIKSAEMLRNQLKSMETQNTEQVDIIEEEIKQIANESIAILDSISELRISQEVLGMLQSYLRDDGIKLKIINIYLPVINQLIKKYLDILGFDVGFTFDERFNEVIKSRNRDTFSYNNFSEGEKLRIDMCLLFVFRDIAKMKNSTATNLLILDEVGSSVLDEYGVTALCALLKTNKEESNSAIFMISHSPEPFKDIIDSYMKVTKRGLHTVVNFS